MPLAQSLVAVVGYGVTALLYALQIVIGACVVSRASSQTVLQSSNSQWEVTQAQSH